LIPWADIADVRVTRRSSGPSLEIRVLDEAPYLRRAPVLLPLLMRLSLRTGHGLLSISERGLDTRVVSLHAEIEARAPHTLRR
jgi:hypothetical protein